MLRTVDVAVVGCGPVGAVLAALLGRRGLDVAVVERDKAVFPLPRAAHIDHTGLRTLQEVGVLERLLPRMIANPGLDYVAADGRPLVRIPGDQASVSGLPASMYFHQPEFDGALREAAAAAADLRLGVAFEGLEEHAHGVRVHTDEGAFEAAWVVGCDGASSAVRAALGSRLESLDFDERWLVVDVVLHEAAPALQPRAIGYCDPARPAFAIPMPGARHRFELRLFGAETAEDVLPELARWLPPGSAAVERAAVYVFHGLVAERWREGRVLLAGDAAHQMPPFLGQGLCSGLRDAVNLAWKLERVVRHGAPVALLDTYGHERRPHVREIVAAAIALGRMMGAPEPDEAAVPVAFTLPPLRGGPLVLAGGGELFPQPKLGGRLLDDLVGGRFLVLGDALDDDGYWTRELGALVATPAELGDDGRLERWLARRRTRVAVIRPDRYVLAAGAALPPITAAVQHLLGRSGEVAATR